MGHAATGGSGQWPELDALVDRLLDARADIARAQAVEATVLSDAIELVLTLTERYPSRGSDLPLREVAAELATAMRVSDRTVQRRLGDASTLVNHFPATLQAWQRAEIDAAHVAAIVSVGAHLPEELRERYEALALEAARHESANRMQQIARAIAASVDPEGTVDRMRRAESERQVRVYDTADGMARLLADVPAVLAHAIFDRLTEQGRHVVANGCGDDESWADDVASESGACSTEPSAADAVTGPTCAGEPNEPEDSRTIDQLRADILCDTLLSGAPTAHGTGLEAIAAQVQLTIPLRSLAGASDEPALLADGEPVSPDTVRLLAGLAPGWDRVFTHPATGAVCAVDRYRPSAGLRRLLRARDEHCRFPGCRRTAHRCDLDHTRDAARGGPTRVENLGHLCRRHHTLKHETAWTVTQHPGGVLEWRSPTGRHHRDRPASTVRFVPDSEPAPF